MSWREEAGRAIAGTTPAPWAPPTANVFRLFAWDGNRPTRCIIADAMVDVNYGQQRVAWPKTDESAQEACANLRFISKAREYLPLALDALDGKDEEIASLKEEIAVLQKSIASKNAVLSELRNRLEED